MFKKQLLSITLVLLLTACMPAPPSTPDNILVPPPTEVTSETPVAIPTETVAPRADGCSTEAADLKLLMNAEEGYCLLYPADDFAQAPRFIVINPARKTADTPGAAWVDIIVEAANGRTAAQAADEQIAAAGPGFNITREDVMVDGVPAVVVDGLPGFDPVRIVFIVSNDRVYTLHFMPWRSNPNDTTQLELLYKTIMETMHFLAPTMPLSPGAQ